MRKWLCVVFLGLIEVLPCRAQLTAQVLQQLRDSRAQQLHQLLPSSRGSEDSKIALATIFSEEAILEKAKKAGVQASPSEVEQFLVPLLVKQGLIRVDGELDIKSDSNVRKWLTGQHWSMDQLFRSGEILLLWAKLVSLDTTCTEQEVKTYITQHPEVYLVHPRLQLNLTQFDTPESFKTSARGIDEAETIAPRLSPTSRAALAAVPIAANSSPEWEGLRLYVELDRLDPILRRDLEGKRSGAAFGPISLTDGTVVAGSIAALLPSVDLSRSPAFWTYAIMLAKLNKANQKELFDQISREYLAGIHDSAVRGLFGDILGTVGAGIGALFGGVGAPIGGILGGTVGGWIDGQMNAPSTPSAPNPSGFYPPPTFPPSVGMRPYLGQVPPPMPVLFGGGLQPMPPLNMVPPMPQFYPPFAPFPRPMWGAPIFMPMPAYF